MNPLGNFSHVTRSGNIVLKGGKDIPAPYAPVVVRGKVIGKIHDIIGPVSGPYIIIKPKKGLDPNSLKSAVFFESEKVYKKKKKPYRKMRGKSMAHRTAR